MGLIDRFRVDGKIALVTGAGRGIGQGIAVALAEQGADVVCAARTPDQIEGTAARIRALGRRAIAVPCDVMDRASLDALAARAFGEFGRVDILVNNAGGYPPKPFLQTSERGFEECIRFNVTSAFTLTRLVASKMLDGDGGAVLNISSAAGRIVRAGFAAYGTAKAAMSFMTKQIAHDLAPKVRVNAIAVGAVETSALAPFLNDELRDQMSKLTPMQRIGQVDDIALMALYLCSPASSWVTGKVMEVDGGSEATNWPFE